jgi:hypothetical protein
MTYCFVCHDASFPELDIYGSPVISMFGRVRREVFGAVFVLCKKHEYLTDGNTCADDSTVWIFAAGAGMLGISIGLNSVSSHGPCTAIIVAVAAITGFCLSSIQTLNKIGCVA